MVAPVLQDHITEELHKESAILKERRKLREERATARGSSGQAGGKGDKNMQSKVDSQAARIKQLEASLAEAKNSGPPKGGKGG